MGASAVMDPTVANIWALCLVAFVCKSIADSYVSYFKWVQALEVRRSSGVVHNTAQWVVSLVGNPNSLVWLGVGCILIVCIALLLRQDLRFPVLTLVNLAVSAAISVAGCFGDLSRRNAMRSR
jgi:hypothetical protein